jgi:hypothetical protein
MPAIECQPSNKHQQLESRDHLNTEKVKELESFLSLLVLILFLKWNEAILDLVSHCLCSGISPGFYFFIFSSSAVFTCLFEIG